MRTISSPGDNALPNPIVPGSSRETSVTTHAAGPATRHQIIRGQPDVDGGVGVDAHSVGHGLDCSESLELERHTFILL